MLRRCRWCRWRPCRLRRTRERRRSLVVDRSRAGGRRTVPDATSIAEYCVLEPLPLEALGEQVLFEGLLVLAITPFRAAALALARFWWAALVPTLRLICAPLSSPLRRCLHPPAHA